MYLQRRVQRCARVDFGWRRGTELREGLLNSISYFDRMVVERLALKP